MKETNQTNTKMEAKHKTMKMKILRVIMGSINMTKMVRNSWTNGSREEIRFRLLLECLQIFSK